MHSNPRVITTSLQRGGISGDNPRTALAVSLTRKAAEAVTKDTP